MPDQRWILYGAYGYTGRLIATEAIRRGHRPLLAGRSAEKLAPMAERLGLDWLAVGLDDQAALQRATGQVELVYHAAGPFMRTSGPMIDACLATGTHYLDLTGEIPVFQATFARDEAACRAGVALISGVGFDVVPSDCLAVHVAAQVPGAQQLDIGMTYRTQPSRGTARTVLESISNGGLVRRAGRLLPWPLGEGSTRVHFPIGDRALSPIPLADLETAYRSTGIANITTYLALSPPVHSLASLVAPLAGRLLSIDAVRSAAGWLVDRTMHGPDEKMRKSERAYLWARARHPEGAMAEGWLITPEPYEMTALLAPLCVERVLKDRPSGALSPAQAFGADFVLAVPGVVRR